MKIPQERRDELHQILEEMIETYEHNSHPGIIVTRNTHGLEMQGNSIIAKKSIGIQLTYEEKEIKD